MYKKTDVDEMFSIDLRGSKSKKSQTDAIVALFKSAKRLTVSLAGGGARPTVILSLAGDRNLYNPLEDTTIAFGQM